jgi:arsenite/tail-anchored protein-transporting ATPase
MRDLIELAPPGIDELVATVEVMDTIASGREPGYDLIVMDTAPTGHALRLIEMPIHDWVKALVAILLKYQPLVGIGELGSVLLRWSQGLGRLRELMSDASRCRFVAVTRAAALPRAETIRLFERLTAARMSAPVVVVNATGAGTCRRCRTQRAAELEEIARLRGDLEMDPGPRVLITPAEVPPPFGPNGLEAWRERWAEIAGPSRARRSGDSAR